MIFGFDLEVWNKTGIKVPLQADICQYKQILLTGGTGTGKSYSILFMLMGFAREGCEIYFCDFKGDTFFNFMKESPHYYGGNSVYDGIKEYYAKYTEQRLEGRRANHEYLLVVDEYPSLLSFFNTIDKKKGTEILNDIAEIMMLGRGIGFGTLITTQVASASLFKDGSRENFQIKCCLGNLSREQRQMFEIEKEEEIIYGVGEGTILFDGKLTEKIKMPKIMDIEKWKSNIIYELNKNKSDESIENIKS